MLDLLPMGLMPTETVVFQVAEASEPDDYGNTTLVYNDYIVDGCLVAPFTSTDAGFQHELHDLTRVSISLPKTFKKSLSNAKVLLRGETYSVEGNPIAVTSSPIAWDRTVVCELVKNA